MTKITNELLEDYAMLYPRIECVKIKQTKKEIGLFKPMYSIPFFDDDFFNLQVGNEIEYIQLRSIESITDEELDKALEMKSSYDRLDYYREIGVAMKFRGITVDELLESGKLKLI